MKHGSTKFSRWLLLTTAATAVLSGEASAQTRPDQTGDQAEAPPSIDGARTAGQTGEEILVTGSRIRRSEFTSSQPIQVITSEEAELEGAGGAAEILQGSSLASGSAQVSNSLNGVSSFNGQVVSPGSSTLSLRGLGAQRTLFLLNGRRTSPAGVRGRVGAFDLNVIPSSLIERVEILKDGASSIYGSDAVAGVVNIITRRNQNGGRINAYTNLSENSGGEQYRIDASWGHVFERGFVQVGAEYYRQQALTFADRHYLFCSEDYVFNAASGERADFINRNTGDFVCNQNIPEGQVFVNGGFYVRDATQTVNNPAGNVFAGWSRVRVNGNQRSFELHDSRDPRQGLDTAITPVERYTLTGSAAYELSDAIEVYGEALFNRRISRQTRFTQIVPPVLSTSNPFNPFPSSAVRPINPYVSESRQRVDYLRFVGGLRGSFSGWDWDIYTSYGRSDGIYDTDVALNSRLNSTALSTRDPVTGIISCPSPGNDVTCVPVNFFRPGTLEDGTFTDQELAYLTTRAHGQTSYTQHLIEGSLSGNLFDLPAGPVGVAVGFQWRREAIDDLPGPEERGGDFLARSAAQPTKGSDVVREVFGEINIPLLRDRPGFHSLTLNGSGRFSDYRSFGSTETFHAGLNWEIVPEFRIRANYGTSFRAPALYELFLGSSTSSISQFAIDPCVNWGASTNQVLRTNCAADNLPANWAGYPASATVITKGGLGFLVPETSRSQNIGVVFAPRFADLNVAVDYYEITINDQVGSIGAANAIASCYNDPRFRAGDGFCNLFGRDTNPGSVTFGSLLNIIDSAVNVDRQRQRGIDVSSRIRFGDVGIGALTITSQLTWTLADRIALFVGTERENNGIVGEPKFTGNVNVRLDRGDWTFFYAVDLIGPSSDVRRGLSELGSYAPTGLGANAARFVRDTPFTTYHDLSIRRRWNDLTVQVGVQNLFDKQPPAVSFGTGVSGRLGNVARGPYDYIGRRFFASIGVNF